MAYTVNLDEKAVRDIKSLKESGNKAVIRKLENLLVEIREHPRSGTGQIEQLRHYTAETWSRRINREHRMVYHILDETVTVTIVSVCGHYEDK